MDLIYCWGRIRGLDLFVSYLFDRLDLLDSLCGLIWLFLFNSSPFEGGLIGTSGWADGGRHFGNFRFLGALGLRRTLSSHFEAFFNRDCFPILLEGVLIFKILKVLTTGFFFTSSGLGRLLLLLKKYCLINFWGEKNIFFNYLHGFVEFKSDFWSWWFDFVVWINCVGRSSILSMTILFEVSSETKEPISGSCLKKYFVFKS